MRKCIKFPSIEQFRHVVKHVTENSKFEGLDENNNPIFNPLKECPTLEFKGTVKLHGTNAGISYNNEEGMWYQSRENIITPQKDNAGFAFWADSKKDIFKEIIDSLNIDLDNNTVTIFFEWIGKGIQKGVAVSELQKAAVVIGCKITPNNEDDNAWWIDHSNIRNNEHRIFNILDFKTFSVIINFNDPLLSQNEIVNLTIEVEDECPFGKHFGVSGIGEGIVFSYTYPNGTVIRFKSKGEKHQKSKVITLKNVDEDKIKAINNFCEGILPQWRLDQGIENVFDVLNGGSIDISKTGNYIKWIMDDILKEESDLLVEHNLSPKDISKKVSEISKKYLFSKI